MEQNKRIRLEQITDYVHPGERLWVGGWTLIRKPMAMVFQLIRAGVRNLHIVNNPGGPDTDLLIGAGCVDKTETSYIGHEVFGHPYNFIRQYEKDADVPGFLHDDWTVGSGTMRILAGAMGIPFIPTRFMRGSDLLNPNNDGFATLRGKDPKVAKKKFVTMTDPFWEGEEVVLVPAIRPDVCILHVQEVGEDGTARITGGSFLDYYAAVAAKVTVISAEKIVANEKLLENREANVIPGEMVDAIVEVPFGAHPTAVHGYYDNDPWWFQEYIKASKETESMQKWLAHWVHGVDSFADYLARIGEKRLAKLVADPDIGYAPDILRRLDKIGEDC